MIDTSEFPAVYLIAPQDQDREDMTDEEKSITIEMGIRNVNFEGDGGVYKDKNDAIAVMEKLIENKTSRKLAVISAIM